MKNKKDKNKEPFDPQRTPEPPQVKDPNVRENKDENKRESPTAGTGQNQQKEKQHLLSDDADIDDETTI